MNEHLFRQFLKLSHIATMTIAHRLRNKAPFRLHQNQSKSWPGR